jgi:hypothetical protein
MKRVITAGVIVGLLTLGSVGVAAAQTNGSNGPSSPPAPNSATHEGRYGRRGLVVLRAAATALGVKPRDLLTGLCSGKTLAQLAAEHGKSTQDVISALVKAADARIDRAVQAGRIDATQAAQRKTQIEARVTNLVNSFHLSSQRCQRVSGGGASKSGTGT